jgi:DNA-binding PadR family transcriptional regulator
MGAPARSTTEWAVLGLLTASPAHGFALARELSPGRPLGQVWTVARPLVYRAIAALEGDGLVSLQHEEESRLGPRRTVYRATERGAAAFSRWLSEPVAHPRDMRSQLLLKLAFLSRREESAGALLTAQVALLDGIVAGLTEKVARATGFERTLALWRLESANAVVRFVRLLATELPR